MDMDAKLGEQSMKYLRDPLIPESQSIINRGTLAQLPAPIVNLSFLFTTC